ncbi:hypothetical protein M885DRAFT_514418 [Pelagophyceae sp. CCMP2097]|nr:hypothetical protein M885DRAFT_514418 [Pelagophyceae sp. CCMP2097]
MSLASASVDELKEALHESLDARGILSEMRARLRAEIFRAMDAGEAPQPKNTPIETLAVAELFREFLQFSGYAQTLSVFDAEAGVRADDARLSREMLAEDMGLAQEPESQQLPLIYGIIEAVKRNQELRRGADDR